MQRHCSYSSTIVAILVFHSMSQRLASTRDTCLYISLAFTSIKSVACTDLRRGEQCHVQASHHTTPQPRALLHLHCRVHQPYKLNSTGVTDVGTPSLGVQEPNMAQVQTAWPHWKIDTARMPLGTRAIWQEHLGTSHGVTTGRSSGARNHGSGRTPLGSSAVSLRSRRAWHS